jgi:hypothetical protein
MTVSACIQSTLTWRKIPRAGCPIKPSPFRRKVWRLVSTLAAAKTNSGPQIMFSTKCDLDIVRLGGVKADIKIVSHLEDAKLPAEPQLIRQPVTE